MNDKGWTLEVWREYFLRAAGIDLPPITPGEIESARVYLRDRNYPIPLDCPGTKCNNYRPACRVKVCKIAIDMCGD